MTAIFAAQDARASGPLAQRFARFWADTEGAVTVDWVVLTAAIVGLAVAILVVVGAGTKEISQDVAQCITITGNRMITGFDGTFNDYTRELGVAARNCSRIK